MSTILLSDYFTIEMYSNVHTPFSTRRIKISSFFKWVNSFKFFIEYKWQKNRFDKVSE